MQISVSCSMRHSVRGTPSSWLKFPSLAIVRACGAQSAARMSFVEVLPVEPVMPTSRPPQRERTAPAEPGERLVRVARHEHGDGAAGECVLDEVAPARDGDEQVALLDAARVDLDAGHLVGPGLLHDLAQRIQLGDRDRDHAGAPSRRSTSRATTLSSKGWTTPAISWPCSCPLPAITTTSPSVAPASALSIAARRSGSTSSSGAPASTSSMIACGILGARVVGGEDRAIGELRGDPSHQRALAPVAVAAAAEDADQAPGRELARRPEDVLERARLVRVVDEHRERLPLVDLLEAPGNAVDRLEAPHDRVVVDPERARGRRGDMRVGAVERAAQPQLRVERRRRIDEDRVRQLGGEPAAVVVADVDDGAVGLVEEPPLGREVLLHGAVEVEVVLAQVREHEHREARAVEPPLHLGDRRRLHRDDRVAGVEHRAKEPLQVDRLRCVQVRREPLGADPPLDVRQQPRPPARGFEDRVAGSTSSSSCPPCRSRPRRRAPASGRRRTRPPRRHGVPRVRDDELRHRNVELPLDDERDGAARDRLAARGRAVARRPGTQKKSAPGATGGCRRRGR